MPPKARPQVAFRLSAGPHVVDLSEPGLAILCDKKTRRRVAVMSRAAYDKIAASPRGRR